MEAKLAAGAWIDEADSEGGSEKASLHPMEGRDDVDPLVAASFPMRCPPLQREGSIERVASKLMSGVLFCSHTMRGNTVSLKRLTGERGLCYSSIFSFLPYLPPQTCPCSGRTPLMIACALGDAAMTSLLVKRLIPPASVAVRTMEGWTPLMIACGGGKLEVVKELMDVGAGLHDRDSVFGSNPLMWACGGGHSEVVRWVIGTKIYWGSRRRGYMIISVI